MRHIEPNVCPSHDARSWCCDPAHVEHRDLVKRSHVVFVLALAIALAMGAAWASYTSSRDISARADGRTVLIVGSRSRGLVQPTLQGTNCGVWGIDKAWLVVNFGAITMPAHARPDTTCASLRAMNDEQ